MSDAFSGKVAIVTGGASGIGRALVQALAARHARVVVADINEDGAETVAAAVRDGGGRAEAAALDVTDGEAVRACVQRVAETHGSVDLMFNNAGIAIIGEAALFEPAQWDRLVDINIRGVIHGTTAAYAVMAEQGDGHIVNTASIAGLVPSPMFTAYAMTKHAVVGLSTSLRVEAARKGVRVSALCPGIIDTPMVDKTSELVGIDRDKATADMTITPYPVDRCARDALAGVERNKAIILVTTFAKTLHGMYRLTPALARAFLRRSFDKERDKLS